ncbi:MULTISPECIES: acyl-CoA dehydrogenase family protein [Bacillaceae]|uniref:acyl-CoA dehydrogenase family protein n=2 Tax=Bacillales TaxID=1385 RepID=UPI000BFDB69A|nr:acyl-CoA dehydrogenase family protein [Bacillus sp. AFS031507]PGY12997.1 acyl-CoA dehydrogenase [Bacillus sp. AFS031507]
MVKTTNSSTKTTFDLFNTDRPFCSQEHEMFRSSLRKFIEKEVNPYYEEWEDKGSIPREVYKKMGDQGFLSPQVDPAYGGLGLDFGFNLVLSEEMSRVGGGTAGVTIHSSIVVPYLEAYGTEEQKKKYLPKCVNGEILTAVAMTEPGTGSDLASVRTTAVRDGDHYVINGQKTFITNGINAELFFVVVKTDPNATPAHKGVSLIMVEGDTPGFSRGRKLKKLGMRSSDTAELIFEDARVPVSNLLGEEGKGFYILMDKLQQERIMAANGAFAQAQEMLKATIAYVKERQAFGKPISSFQNTQFEISEMATELSMARSFLDNLANQHMKGENIVTQVSMAKWWITDMARRMAARCLQLYGGYGFMEEYPIARRYRDIAVLPIAAGSNEIMKNIIAKNLGL